MIIRQIQKVTLAADTALSGEFTLSYPDVGSTAPLAHDASAEVLASALRALGSEIGDPLSVSRERTGISFVQFNFISCVKYISHTLVSGNLSRPRGYRSCVQRNHVPEAYVEVRGGGGTWHSKYLASTASIRVPSNSPSDTEVNPLVT